MSEIIHAHCPRCTMDTTFENSQCNNCGYKPVAPVAEPAPVEAPVAEEAEEAVTEVVEPALEVAPEEEAAI